MQVTTGAATRVGRARLVNQDAVYVCCAGDGQSLRGLAVVADGMGGLANGEDASALALNSLKRRLAAACTPELTSQQLHEAFIAAHEVVWTAGQTRGARMGTTLVAAVVRGDEAIVGNVGDSRCYLIADDVIECLTVDHSLLPADEGCLRDEELRQSPASNVITRCIGADDAPPVVDLWRVRLGGGSSLVLCSDGLHRSVAPETILEVMQSKAPQEAAHALVREAVQAGAGDDVSVAVLRYAP